MAIVIGTTPPDINASSNAQLAGDIYIQVNGDLVSLYQKTTSIVWQLITTIDTSGTLAPRVASGTGAPTAASIVNPREADIYVEVNVEYPTLTRIHHFLSGAWVNKSYIAASTGGSSQPPIDPQPQEPATPVPVGQPWDLSVLPTAIPEGAVENEIFFVTAGGTYAGVVLSTGDFALVYNLDSTPAVMRIAQTFGSPAVPDMDPITETQLNNYLQSQLANPLGVSADSPELQGSITRAIIAAIKSAVSVDAIDVEDVGDWNPKGIISRFLTGQIQPAVDLVLSSSIRESEIKLGLKNLTSSKPALLIFDSLPSGALVLHTPQGSIRSTNPNAANLVGVLKGTLPDNFLLLARTYEPLLTTDFMGLLSSAIDISNQGHLADSSNPLTVGTSAGFTQVEVYRDLNNNSLMGNIAEWTVSEGYSELANIVVPLVGEFSNVELSNGIKGAKAIYLFSLWDFQAPSNVNSNNIDREHSPINGWLNYVATDYSLIPNSLLKVVESPAYPLLLNPSIASASASSSTLLESDGVFLRVATPFNFEGSNLGLESLANLLSENVLTVDGQHKSNLKYVFYVTNDTATPVSIKYFTNNTGSEGLPFALSYDPSMLPNFSVEDVNSLDGTASYSLGSGKVLKVTIERNPKRVPYTSRGIDILPTSLVIFEETPVYSTIAPNTP